MGPHLPEAAPPCRAAPQLTEDAIIEGLEKMCDPDKEAGEWITKIDLQEEGDKLKLVDMDGVGGGGGRSRRCMRALHAPVRTQARHNAHGVPAHAPAGSGLRLGVPHRGARVRAGAPAPHAEHRQLARTGAAACSAHARALPLEARRPPCACPATPRHDTPRRSWTTWICRTCLRSCTRAPAGRPSRAGPATSTAARAGPRRRPCPRCVPPGSAHPPA